MIHTTEEIQTAFEYHFTIPYITGKMFDPYFRFMEIPPVKIWYDGGDHSFHTSVGVSIDFESYENNYLDCFMKPDYGITRCLGALYDKIIAEFKERGIILHSRYPD